MFKISLYEVKTLFELQVYQIYLKNSSASKIAAARNQTAVLNGTSQILFGHPSNNGNSSEHSTSATAIFTSFDNRGVTNPDEATASPSSSNDVGVKKRKQNHRLLQWQKLQFCPRRLHYRSMLYCNRLLKSYPLMKIQKSDMLHGRKH
jgi:hypothetical protein